MKTLIDINETLMKQAMRAGGLKTKKETVVIALEEFIKMKQRQVLKALAGSGSLDISFKELKTIRNKQGKAAD